MAVPDTYNHSDVVAVQGAWLLGIPELHCIGEWLSKGREQHVQCRGCHAGELLTVGEGPEQTMCSTRAAMQGNRWP